jgi:glycosyltransferase involved in cell wall biosynthesis
VTEVTAVIPTHNRSRLLAQALRSALWQEGVDLEIVVVDDGSSDDTPDVVASFKDERVRLVRNEVPQRVAAARNRGLAEARGRWVGFLDDDDIWAPNKLARQLRAAGQAQRSWVYTGAVKVDLGQRVVGGVPPPKPRWAAARLVRWNSIPGGCSGVVARREVLERAGGFDRGLVNLADWDLWIRLGRQGLPACAPGPLVGYRFHAGNKSLDTALILREAEIVRDRYGLDLDWAAIHHYLAELCRRSGRRKEALRHYAVAAAKGEIGPVALQLGLIASRRLPGRLNALLGERSVYSTSAKWRGPAEEWLARAVSLSRE